MIYKKWNPARQMGWYRIRNQRICVMHREGVPTCEISLRFNLMPATINQIVKACSEVSKNGG